MYFGHISGFFIFFIPMIASYRKSLHFVGFITNFGVGVGNPQ